MYGGKENSSISTGQELGWEVVSIARYSEIHNGVEKALNLK